MQPKENKIKKLLREKGLDGAIVSSPENFHYVTGFGGHQHTVSRQPGFTLAVMRADDQVLVRRSKYTTKLVRLTEKSFCEIFAKKMLPGGFDDEK